MTGKIIGIFIVIAALTFGAVVYYSQVYYYYEDLPADQARVVLTPLDGSSPEPIAFSNFNGIDANSSPIRLRACFTTTETPQSLANRFQPYPGAEPRNAPDWFDCFDAAAIADRISDGTARVFASERNFEFGIDRVVAITDDGQGYIWEEINECGDKAYDGTPLGEDCPARD